MVAPRMLLRDEVYAALRDQIVRGELRSGQQLPVRKLAEQLGVSRTPLREALRRLEDEGLVEAVASRWTRVAAVDLPRARKVYEVLTVLERLAVFAGEFNADEIGVLQEANERLAAAVAGGNTHGAYLADRDFHDALIKHARNDELERIVADLRVKTRLVEHELFGGSSAGQASLAEHEAILDGLLAHDPARAASAIEDNHQRGLDRLARSAATTID